MRIHYLKHVPFEGLANIEKWAKEKQYIITSTEMYLGENLPSFDSFDFLIVMGGPMNIYEEEQYPWLAKEKVFIKDAIAKGKTILGVCLGAQLLADVLGAKVVRNKQNEIGWLKVVNSGLSSFNGILPQEFMAFHWHGDTFLLPEGANLLCSSEGCVNQGFEINNGKIVGVQFHLESNEDSINLLIENCSEELVEDKYIQTASEIKKEYKQIDSIYENMKILLNYMEKATI